MEVHRSSRTGLVTVGEEKTTSRRSLDGRNSVAQPRGVSATPSTTAPSATPWSPSPKLEVGEPRFDNLANLLSYASEARHSPRGEQPEPEWRTSAVGGPEPNRRLNETAHHHDTRGYTSFDALLRGEFIAPPAPDDTIQPSKVACVWDKLTGHRTREIVQEAPPPKPKASAAGPPEPPKLVRHFHERLNKIGAIDAAVFAAKGAPIPVWPPPPPEEELDSTHPPPAVKQQSASQAGPPPPAEGPAQASAREAATDEGRRLSQAASEEQESTAPSLPDSEPPASSVLGGLKDLLEAEEREDPEWVAGDDRLKVIATEQPPQPGQYNPRLRAREVQLPGRTIEVDTTGFRPDSSDGKRREAAVKIIHQVEHVSTLIEEAVSSPPVNPLIQKFAEHWNAYEAGRATKKTLLQYTEEDLKKRHETKAALKESVKVLKKQHDRQNAEMDKVKQKLQIQNRHTFSVLATATGGHEPEYGEKMLYTQLRYQELAALAALGSHELGRFKLFSNFRLHLKDLKEGKQRKAAKEEEEEESGGNLTESNSGEEESATAEDNESNGSDIEDMRREMKRLQAELQVAVKSQREAERRRKERQLNRMKTFDRGANKGPQVSDQLDVLQLQATALDERCELLKVHVNRSDDDSDKLGRMLDFIEAGQASIKRLLAQAKDLEARQKETMERLMEELDAEIEEEAERKQAEMERRQQQVDWARGAGRDAAVSEQKRRQMMERQKMETRRERLRAKRDELLSKNQAWRAMKAVADANKAHEQAGPDGVDAQRLSHSSAEGADEAFPGASPRGGAAGGPRSRAKKVSKGVAGRADAVTVHLKVPKGVKLGFSVRIEDLPPPAAPPPEAQEAKPELQRQVKVLVIESIAKTGALADYNSEHADCQIRLGDRIECNELVELAGQVPLTDFWLASSASYELTVHLGDFHRRLSEIQVEAASLLDEINGAFQNAEGMELSAEEKSLLQELQQSTAEYGSVMDGLGQGKRGKRLIAAKDAMNIVGQLKNVEAKMTKAMDKLHEAMPEGDDGTVIEKQAPKAARRKGRKSTRKGTAGAASVAAAAKGGANPKQKGKAKKLRGKKRRGAASDDSDEASEPLSSEEEEEYDEDEDEDEEAEDEYCDEEEGEERRGRRKKGAKKGKGKAAFASKGAGSRAGSKEGSESGSRRNKAHKKSRKLLQKEEEEERPESSGDDDEMHLDLDRLLSESEEAQGTQERSSRRGSRSRRKSSVSELAAARQLKGLSLDMDQVNDGATSRSQSRVPTVSFDMDGEGEDGEHRGLFLAERDSARKSTQGSVVSPSARTSLLSRTSRVKLESEGDSGQSGHSGYLQGTPRGWLNLQTRFKTRELRDLVLPDVEEDDVEGQLSLGGPQGKVQIPQHPDRDTSSDDDEVWDNHGDADERVLNKGYKKGKMSKPSGWSRVTSLEDQLGDEADQALGTEAASLRKEKGRKSTKRKTELLLGAGGKGKLKHGHLVPSQSREDMEGHQVGLTASGELSERGVADAAHVHGHGGQHGRITKGSVFHHEGHLRSPRSKFDSNDSFPEDIDGQAAQMDLEQLMKEQGVELSQLQDVNVRKQMRVEMQKAIQEKQKAVAKKAALLGALMPGNAAANLPAALLKHMPGGALSAMKQGMGGLNAGALGRGGASSMREQKEKEVEEEKVLTKRVADLNKLMDFWATKLEAARNGDLSLSHRPKGYMGAAPLGGGKPGLKLSQQGRAGAYHLEIPEAGSGDGKSSRASSKSSRGHFGVFFDEDGNEHLDLSEMPHQEGWQGYAKHHRAHGGAASNATMNELRFDLGGLGVHRTPSGRPMHHTHSAGDKNVVHTRRLSLHVPGEDEASSQRTAMPSAHRGWGRGRVHHEHLHFGQQMVPGHDRSSSPTQHRNPFGSHGQHGVRANDLFVKQLLNVAHLPGWMENQLSSLTLQLDADARYALQLHFSMVFAQPEESQIPLLKALAKGKVSEMSPLRQIAGSHRVLGAASAMSRMLVHLLERARHDEASMPHADIGQVHIVSRSSSKKITRTPSALSNVSSRTASKRSAAPPTDGENVRSDIGLGAGISAVLAAKMAARRISRHGKKARRRRKRGVDHYLRSDSEDENEKEEEQVVVRQESEKEESDRDEEAEKHAEAVKAQAHGWAVADLRGVRKEKLTHQELAQLRSQNQTKVADVAVDVRKVKMWWEQSRTYQDKEETFHDAHAHAARARKLRMQKVRQHARQFSTSALGVDQRKLDFGWAVAADTGGVAEEISIGGIDVAKANSVQHQPSSRTPSRTPSRHSPSPQPSVQNVASSLSLVKLGMGPSSSKPSSNSLFPPGRRKSPPRYDSKVSSEIMGGFQVQVKVTDTPEDNKEPDASPAVKRASEPTRAQARGGKPDPPEGRSRVQPSWQRRGSLGAAAPKRSSGSSQLGEEPSLMLGLEGGAEDTPQERASERASLRARAKQAMSPKNKALALHALHKIKAVQALTSSGLRDAGSQEEGQYSEVRALPQEDTLARDLQNFHAKGLLAKSKEGMGKLLRRGSLSNAAGASRRNSASSGPTLQIGSRRPSGEPSGEAAAAPTPAAPTASSQAEVPRELLVSATPRAGTKSPAFSASQASSEAESWAPIVTAGAGEGHPPAPSNSHPAPAEEEPQASAADAPVINRRLRDFAASKALSLGGQSEGLSCTQGSDTGTPKVVVSAVDAQTAGSDQTGVASSAHLAQPAESAIPTSRRSSWGDGISRRQSMEVWEGAGWSPKAKQPAAPPEPQASRRALDTRQMEGLPVEEVHKRLRSNVMLFHRRSSADSPRRGSAETERHHSAGGEQRRSTERSTPPKAAPSTLDPLELAPVPATAPEPALAEPSGLAETVLEPLSPAAIFIRERIFGGVLPEASPSPPEATPLPALSPSWQASPLPAPSPSLQELGLQDSSTAMKGSVRFAPLPHEHLEDSLALSVRMGDEALPQGSAVQASPPPLAESERPAEPARPVVPSRLSLEKALPRLERFAAIDRLLTSAQQGEGLPASGRAKLASGEAAQPARPVPLAEKLQAIDQYVNGGFLGDAIKDILGPPAAPSTEDMRARQREADRWRQRLSQAAPPESVEPLGRWERWQTAPPVHPKAERGLARLVQAPRKVPLSAR